MLLITDCWCGECGVVNACTCGKPHLPNVSERVCTRTWWELRAWVVVTFCVSLKASLSVVSSQVKTTATTSMSMPRSMIEWRMAFSTRRSVIRIARAM